MKSKKGFYLVSPFLGFFFFLITVVITAIFVSANDQQIITAHSGVTHDLVFISYAIQADVFDVYLQNYLQDVLDNYDVGAPDSLAIRSEIEQRSGIAMSTDLRDTYEELYRKAFNINCKAVDRLYSGIYIKFNDINLDILGTGTTFSFNPYTGGQETAVWPHASRYGLECSVTEPPISVTTDFVSRWYYLDANCICCQDMGWSACGLSFPAVNIRNCPNCIPTAPTTPSIYI